MKNKFDRNTGMSFEESFEKLVTEMWSNLPRAFKEKYGPYKSKHFSELGIGYKIKFEMLEKAGFTGLWFSPEEEEKGGIL